MRIDSAHGARYWTVYHAEACVFLRTVLWVDDETNQWCEVILPLRVINDDVAKTIHQARKIEIYISRKLVIINPIADDAPAEVVEAIGVEA